MRRKVIMFPGGYTKIADDDAIVGAYESITDPPNLPPPDEVAILVASEIARRRILTHAQAVKMACAYNLPSKEK